MTKKKRTAHQPLAEPPRRNFLHKLWTGLGIVILAEVVWVVIAFLRSRGTSSGNGRRATRVTAGTIDGFQPGSVTAFVQGKFYLVCLEDGGFLALSYRCTHLGCTVPWVEEKKQFVCPCHASIFDMRGAVVQSPAPRALDLFPVFIENRVVQVDTGKVIQRREFLRDQVAYPHSPGS